MNWEPTFAPLFHPSWHEKIRPFIESEKADKLYAYLKERKAGGHRNIPSGPSVYRAFFETPLDKLKVVFMGLAPYSRLINNASIADGLAFSCSITNKEQPSLELIWDAVEDDLYNGLNLEMLRETDLTRWANEGVLLVNAALTTEKDKADCHVGIWDDFWEYVFSEIFAYQSGLIFVFFGAEAQRFARYTTPFIHYTKEVEHPAYAARLQRPFKHDKLFSWINYLLKQNNNETIHWVEEAPF